MKWNRGDLNFNETVRLRWGRSSRHEIKPQLTCNQTLTTNINREVHVTPHTIFLSPHSIAVRNTCNFLLSPEN